MELTTIRQESLNLASQLRGLSEQEDDRGQRVRIGELASELDQIAQDTESPIRIGILGGFSSGKTRLIECLMGAGGRLPVSVNPSTGNIVVLGFHAQEGLRETRFQSFVGDKPQLFVLVRSPNPFQTCLRPA